MHYIIYCDESSEKGQFYSNFYGGALLRANDRQHIEQRLLTAKSQTNIQGELKWTKISEYNEAAYRDILSTFFECISEGIVKCRIMFSQNINQTSHIIYESENEYFMLYYQFVKHAFGLKYCNLERQDDIYISILMDEVPIKLDSFKNFKKYMSSLSAYPVFYRNRIFIDSSDIVDVDSSKHVILQMVDIVLGSMQFRLNELHKVKPAGSRYRGKRTRAKERVYKFINEKIREIYPGFNIGISTGEAGGRGDRWNHPYRHWCFVPRGSTTDLRRSKKAAKR